MVTNKVKPTLFILGNKARMTLEEKLSDLLGEETIKTSSMLLVFVN